MVYDAIRRINDEVGRFVSDQIEISRTGASSPPACARQQPRSPYDEHRGAAAVTLDAAAVDAPRVVLTAGASLKRRSRLTRPQRRKGQYAAR